jgi:hypothetical protein
MIENEQRSGEDRRAEDRGGRRSGDSDVRGAYRKLDEAARLTKEARQTIAEAHAHARLSDAYTPSRLANITGISYHVVLRDIESKDLKAFRVQRGSQVRLFVHPVDAAAWLTQIGLAHLAPVVSVAPETDPPTSV